VILFQRLDVIIILFVALEEKKSTRQQVAKRKTHSLKLSHGAIAAAARRTYVLFENLNTFLFLER